MVLGNPGPQQSAPVYTGPTAEQIAAQQAAQAAAQQAAAREAQRQATLRAAHAANDAGLSFWKRHEWGAAVEQFRQALARSPGDKVIQSNLAKATEQLRQEQWQETRKQEDTNMASQMSATLQQLSAGMPDFDGHNSGSVPATGSGAALDFMPAGNTAPPAKAIGQTNDGAGAQAQPTPWQDPNVVDLRGTTKTSVDPVAMKNTASAQPAAFRKNAPAPPSPNVQLPQNQDIELLIPPPSKPQSAWPGAQRPANEPKLVNPLDKEKETQELAKAIFESPAMEDLMLKEMLKDADKVPTSPTVNTAAPASKTTTTAAGPHN